MNKFRILVIDGGGIRGIVPAKIIERLNKATGFLASVDLAAGTSTGGLISLAIADYIPPASIIDIYMKEGKKIFADSWTDDIADLFCLTGADYDIKNLEEVLRRIFGDTQIKNLMKYALVTAFDLDNESKENRTWKPKLFSNLPLSENGEETPAYKAGLYTAAAPVYFPAVDGYVDGGVFAVNPALIALCSVVNCFGVDLKDIRMLSIGTGRSPKSIEGKDNDWGYAQWLNSVTSMMMDGQSISTDEQCRQLLGENYFRIEPWFPDGVEIKMDEVKKLDYMLKFAEDFNLENAFSWLKNNF
jgi:patatin-like phospholipase/acyl hydrolase